MRTLADSALIQGFLDRLAIEARSPTRIFLTGGASAVLIGWRSTTVDVDIKLVPDDDRLLRAIPTLKEALQINVELACPADFIPVPEGWIDRGRFISQIGHLGVYHFDFYAQALAKIERGHRQDRSDVSEMLSRGLVVPDRLRAAFEQIEPLLYRFPAIDPPSFRRGLGAALEQARGS